MALELFRAEQLKQTANTLDWMKGGVGGSPATNFNATSQGLAPVIGILLLLILFGIVRS